MGGSYNPLRWQGPTKDVGKLDLPPKVAEHYSFNVIDVQSAQQGPGLASAGHHAESSVSAVPALAAQHVQGPTTPARSPLSFLPPHLQPRPPKQQQQQGSQGPTVVSSHGVPGTAGLWNNRDHTVSSRGGKGSSMHDALQLGTAAHDSATGGTPTAAASGSEQPVLQERDANWWLQRQNAEADSDPWGPAPQSATPTASQPTSPRIKTSTYAAINLNNNVLLSIKNDAESSAGSSSSSHSCSPTTYNQQQSTKLRLAKAAAEPTAIASAAVAPVTAARYEASTGPAARTRCKEKAAAAVTAAAGGDGSNSRKGSSTALNNLCDSSNGTSSTSSSVIDMALAQLRYDRPDVAQFTTSDLRARISAMTPEVALAAIGALADLPSGWQDGLLGSAGKAAAAAAHNKGESSTASSWVALKQQQSRATVKHLAAVVAQAAAHAAASSTGTKGAGTGGGTAAARGGGCCEGMPSQGLGDPGGVSPDDSEWVTIPVASGTNRSAGSSSSSNKSRSAGSDSIPVRTGSGSAAGAASPPALHAAWASLRSQRPDVFSCLDEAHKSIICQQSTATQIQVLGALQGVPPCAVSSGATGVGPHLTRVISSTLRVEKYAPHPKLKAAVQSYVKHHPCVVPFLDDVFFDRLLTLPLEQALVAVAALDRADYGRNWEAHCRNPSAWLMGVVSNGLRKAGL